MLFTVVIAMFYIRCECQNLEDAFNEAMLKQFNPEAWKERQRKRQEEETRQGLTEQESEQQRQKQERKQEVLCWIRELFVGDDDKDNIQEQYPLLS